MLKNIYIIRTIVCFSYVKGWTELPPQAHTPQDGVWQPVAGTSNKFFVYAAYVEWRTAPAVRIIAATKRTGPDAVFCRLWIHNNRTLTLKAKVQTIRDHMDLKYSAAYVLCLLRDADGVRPVDTVGATIAVIADAAAYRPASNLLIVQNTIPLPGIAEQVHVCVGQPLHASYSRAIWMIEWMELNRLLGVSHFYLYNSSISADTSFLLEYYKSLGLVTVLPWKLPFGSDTEIKREGQLVATNDCLYRSMGTAEWLLVTDVDEVVLPRREQTLPELLDSLSASYTPPAVSPAAFLFRNAFFYLIWEDDQEAKTDLLTARKTRRRATLHNINDRSKYAVKPRETIELGIHYIFELVPGARSVGVDIYRALLHHYRVSCESDAPNCVAAPSTVDRTAHRWTDKLNNRIKSAKDQMDMYKLGWIEAELPPHAHTPQDGVWQPVAGTRNNISVYAAYVEWRTTAAVRIIAATKRTGLDAVFCRLWTHNNRSLTLKAKVQTIRDDMDLKYSAAYVLCLFRNADGVRPVDIVGATIAVIADAAAHRPSSNLLIVQNTIPSPGIAEQVHVCVGQPLHFSYSRAIWMIEWMELNRLLGVSHFYLYNSSISEDTSFLLEYYKSLGLVTVLPWKMPFGSDSEIKTECQLAATNDCLYRSMRTAEWLLVTDVDEVVLPRREQTLPELLDSLSASYAPPAISPAAFLFTNAFFYIFWEDDLEAKTDLLTARKTKRRATPHKINERSKYAVKPGEAIELGFHFIWELVPGATCVGVPIDRALLHHYQVSCESDAPNCVAAPSTVDRTAHRWTDKLNNRIKSAKDQMDMYKLAEGKTYDKKIVEGMVLNMQWKKALESAKGETCDKKTVEGMVLNMLWEKVLKDLDPSTKEQSIKQMRQSSNYAKLIDYLTKANCKNIPQIIDLIKDLILANVILI